MSKLNGRYLRTIYRHLALVTNLNIIGWAPAVCSKNSASRASVLKGTCRADWSAGWSAGVVCFSPRLVSLYFIFFISELCTGFYL